MALPTALLLTAAMSDWQLTVLLSTLASAQVVAVVSQEHRTTPSRIQGAITAPAGALELRASCTLGPVGVAVLIHADPCIAVGTSLWSDMVEPGVRKGYVLRLVGEGEDSSHCVCLVEHSEAYEVAVWPHCLCVCQ